MPIPLIHTHTSPIHKWLRWEWKSSLYFRSFHSFRWFRRRTFTLLPARTVIHFDSLSATCTENILLCWTIFMFFFLLVFWLWSYSFYSNFLRLSAIVTRRIFSSVGCVHVLFIVCYCCKQACAVHIPSSTICSSYSHSHSVYLFCV